MISVQSRRLLLSGNKIGILCLLSILLLSTGACALFNKTSTSPTTDKDTKPAEEVKPRPTTPVEKVDTMEWKKPDEKTTSGPIRNQELIIPDHPEKVNFPKKDKYNVGVLLPLYSQLQKDVLNENVLKMVHFASGLRIAVNKLRNENVSLNIKVLDIELHSNRLEQLMESDSLKEFDFIVGPFKADHLQTLAAYCRKEGKVLLSPWNASPNITKDNPFYFQLKPGLKVHCEAISKDIISNFKSSQVVLVAKESDTREQEYFPYFTNSVAFKSSPTHKNKISQILLKSDKNGRLSSETIRNKLVENQTTVFIVPYWAEEAFILQFLHALNREVSDKYPVVVYGLPQWLDFGKLTYDLFEKLQVRLSYNGFIDKTDPEVIAFRQSYFDQNGVLPLEEAFYGYDMMYWLGTEIKRTKSDFINKVHKKHQTGLFNPIDLHRISYSGGAVSDNFSTFDITENQAISIIRLVDYRFRVAIE
jgi:hypothetical protein